MSEPMYVVLTQQQLERYREAAMSGTPLEQSTAQWLLSHRIVMQQEIPVGSKETRYLQRDGKPRSGTISRMRF